MTFQTPDTSENTAFSQALPGLQLAVDSTSLGAFKTCPRLYYYSIICGWQAKTTSVHLVFGNLVHKTDEVYQHGKALGLPHEEALAEAIHWLLKATWVRALARAWISGDATKNRLTCLRSMVWYLDTYGDNDPLKTLILADGKPAMELSFRFDSGYTFQTTGEKAILCGHLDRVASLGDDYYIPDKKTTGYQIDPGYFSKFTPDNQFSLYTLAGQVAFATPVKGVILDAMQIQVHGTKFQRGLILRSSGQIAEWTEDTFQVLSEMEQAAASGHWRQNDKACHNQFGRPCDFRDVCSRPPGAREQWLQATFKKRVWDPLLRRGEV